MDPKEKEREKRNEGQASQFEALKVINQWIDEKTDNLTQYPPAIRERIKTAVKEAKPDTIEKVKKLIQEQCNEYDQVLEAERARDKALRQQLGLSETDDLATALTEREAERKHLLEEQRKREVAAYIDKEVKGVNYPPIVKNAFLEAVKVDGPTTVEEAKEAIAKHRKHFDKMASELRLQAKGFGGIDVLGPVLEDETGYPEFARVAFEITESFVAHRLAPKRDIYKNAEPTLNEQFALQYLKRFDENYKHHLIAEARQFEEAETTADLSLPYSVMRAIVAEVWATMVAASVFDFGIANNSPDRIYFEEHTKEAGATGSVTDEDFNSGAFTSVNGRSQGEWVQLAHGRVIPGTVVVNVDGGGALIADDDTNYAIDYAAGRIKMFDGGSSDADVAQNTAYEIDYDYDAIREGEGAEIEQAKTVLTFKTLEIGPDRLATDITTEAILFSRSQIGWDAVTRTIFNLVKQIQTRKDQDIFYMALAAVLSISNNFVTWNSGTETVTNLIEKIGQAKTKVRNRHYSADALVISATNADIISNHDHFTAAGKRPDFDLNAQGYIGRVKGLPVFETTNFMDQHIMPVNRELVMHRIFQAMQVEGPYQKYGTNGKLVAAKLYYVEEFNGTDAPVEEKGSSVRIV